jgi:hypothetical protein
MQGFLFGACITGASRDLGSELRFRPKTNSAIGSSRLVERKRRPAYAGWLRKVFAS